MPLFHPLLPYLRRQSGWLWLGAVCGLVMNVSAVLPPIVLGKALDTLAALERQPGAAHRQAFLSSLLTFFGASALYSGFRVGKRLGFKAMENGLLCDLRAGAFSRLLALPMEQLGGRPVGDWMARVGGDVAVLTSGIRDFGTELFDTAVKMISCFVMLLRYDPGLTWTASLPMPLALALALMTGRRVAARTTHAREATASVTALLQEAFFGLRVLRLFGREAAEAERLAALGRVQVARNLALVRLRAGLMPFYSVLGSAGVLWVVAAGGAAAASGRWSVGDFVAYLGLFMTMTGRTLNIARVINGLHSSHAALHRFSSLIVDGGRGTKDPGPAIGGLETLRPGAALELSHVTFRYPNSAAPTLRDVTLLVPAGSFVGVTGPIGSGKSTLARLLLGLYPYEEGSIRVDGWELAAMPAALRTRRITYVPQEPFLFAASLAENITLEGRAPQNNRRLGAVLHLAALTEDLRGFPDGCDTLAGERGVRVSGGQRQRLALARALYLALGASDGSSAALVLLDDTFSAVDVETERCLIANLRQALRGRTVLLFSHRLSAFPLLDAILLLDAGGVRAYGPHAELLARDKLYARIVGAQMEGL